MTLLGMFAKYWQPGTVKTRLAAAIGAENASRFYRASLRTLTERFAGVADARWLVITPAARQREFACFAPPWSVVPQAEGDLGRRIAAFFAEAARSGADRVVLIGSDSPTLPDCYLKSAFERLRDVPVVLGPATDGGYYLIGCRSPAPELFDEIAWSTADVWPQTIERLKKRQIEYAQLPQWYDVDDLPSLLVLHRQLQTEPVDDAMAPLREEIKAIIETRPMPPE